MRKETDPPTPTWMPLREAYCREPSAALPVRRRSGTLLRNGICINKPSLLRSRALAR